MSNRRPPEDERAKTARRERAVRLLIAEFDYEYGRLMNASAGNGKRWDTRRREAVAEIRTAHPDEWAQCLKEART